MAKMLTDLDRPDVPTFYTGKKILITGACGFMGRVLLEKLLRDCPGISRIYLLIRQKRGREPRARLEAMFQSPMFGRLHKEQPNFEEKIRPVRGELGQEGLDLSPEDALELQKETDILFHCAANVRFDLSLKEAITNNTLGTQHVLEFAKTITKLQCFTHVSTSYCHCDLEVLEEKFYPSTDNPKKVIEMVQWMNDSILDIITPKLLGKLPNTYSYSKNLSEQLVQEYSKLFPIVIARPSIVTSAWKEPLPGWVDNLNGPIGLMVAAGKGVLRSMLCKQEHPSELMPVDVAINALILVTYHRCTTDQVESESGPLVFNVTSSSKLMPSWGELVEWGRELIYTNPFSGTVWYPDGSVKTNRFVHEFSVFFYHLLPAYFIDGLLILIGRKRFMVRLHHRIQNGIGLLQYYTTKNWIFRSERMEALRKSLSPKDNECFYTEMNNIDWYNFLRQALLGTRHYCLNDDPQTLPQARRRMHILYLIDLVVRYVFYITLVWALFLWSEPLATAAETALSAAFRTFVALPGVRMLAGDELSETPLEDSLPPI